MVQCTKVQSIKYKVDKVGERHSMASTCIKPVSKGRAIFGCNVEIYSTTDTPTFSNVVSIADSVVSPSNRM